MTIGGRRPNGPVWMSLVRRSNEGGRGTAEPAVSRGRAEAFTPGEKETAGSCPRPVLASAGPAGQGADRALGALKGTHDVPFSTSQMAATQGA